MRRTVIAFCLVASGCKDAAPQTAAKAPPPDRDVYLYVGDRIGLLYSSKDGRLASPDQLGAKTLPDLFTLEGTLLANESSEPSKPSRRTWEFGGEDGHRVVSGPVWIVPGPKVPPRFLVSSPATAEDLGLRSPAPNEGAGTLPDSVREKAEADACREGGTSKTVQHVGGYYVVRTTCNDSDGRPPTPTKMSAFGKDVEFMPAKYLNVGLYRGEPTRRIRGIFGDDWDIRITHLLDLDGDGVDEALAVVKPRTLDATAPRELLLVEGDERVATGTIGYPLESWGLQTPP